MPEAQDPAKIEALWREVLTVGHPHTLSFLPSKPRCASCRLPFAGVGGLVARTVLGRRPSRKSPKFCNVCEDFLPPGGAEIDVAVVFADIRGSTGLGEKLGSTAFAGLLNRFYKVATDAILRHDGSIDKMVGDEVMAVFYPACSGPQYRSASVRMALSLMKAVGYGGPGEPWVPVGIGIQAGPAFMGKVGSGGITDLTVLGDTVNTAARLRDEAKAGEVVISEDLYQGVRDEFPSAEARSVALEGKTDKLPIRILRTPA